MNELEPQSATRTLEPPSLAGHLAVLRPLAPEDYSFIRQVETSAELGPRWRHRGATPSPESWVQGLWDGVLAQFLVIERSSNRPAGLVALYRPDFRDGHAYVAAAAFPPATRSPLLMFGLGLFLRHVFWCWEFRKLYLEIPEYNLPQFESAVGRYIEIEGTLKDHIALGGEHWNQYIASITREGWNQTGARLLESAVRFNANPAPR